MDDFEIVPGDDVTGTLTIKDIDGVPVDLTGAKVWLTVKASYTDPDANAVFKYDTVTNPSNIWIADAESGVVGWKISNTDSVLLTENTSYYYDFQILLSGLVHTVKIGTFRATYQVTRATS